MVIAILGIASTVLLKADASGDCYTQPIFYAMQANPIFECLDDQIGGSATALNDLTDVIIINAQTGEFLKYNGTQWINAAVAPGGGCTTFDCLTDVIILNPQTGQAIIYNGTYFVNTVLPAYQNNTASCDSYLYGHCLFAQKSGVDLQFKKLLSSNSAITLSANSSNIIITGNCNECNTASNLGAASSLAEGLFAQKSGVDLQFKTLLEGSGVGLASNSTHVSITNTSPESTSCNNSANGLGICINNSITLKNLLAGSGVSLAANGTNITISSTVSGESTTCGSTASTGTSLCESSGNVKLKRLLEGSGITISNNGTHITITNASPEATTCTNQGHGAGNVCNGGNVNLKGLAAGTAISLASNGTDITITNSLPEATTGSNLNANNGVFASKVGNDLQFKSLIQGTGITISANSTNITITNSLPESTSCNNLGIGTIICASGNVNLKSLKAGTGLSIGNTANDITYTNSLPEATACTNQGHGAGNVCNGGNVNLKGLAAGTAISLASNGTDITITNSLPEATTGSNLGTSGQAVFSSKVGNDLQFKKITGTGITVTSNSTNVILTVTDATVCSNTGSGNGLCNGGNVSIKSLIGGTGVTITDTTDDYTFASQCANTGTGEAVCESANNINSLIAGNGITIADTSADLTITNSGLYQYTQLCTNVLGSSATSLSCSSFAAKKHLLIVADLRTVTNTFTVGIQFNSDTGTNYAWRMSLSGAADTTGVSAAQCQPVGATALATGEIARLSMEIDNNQAGDRKVGWGSYVGDTATTAATAPARSENACKWGNTAAQITTVTINRAAGTGSLNTNSIIWVYGSD